MTRRHDALIPLTHDHHHALVQARLMIEAGGASDEDRTATAQTFLDFYEEHTLLHFHEEEEVLFPLFLDRTGEASELLTQVLVEHVRIHGLVSGLRRSLEVGPPEGERLEQLGELLKSHVRLEETKLFPLIEQTVPDGELNGVTFAERTRGPT